MTAAQPDRLDRLEVIVDSIARSLDNLIQAQGNQQTAIDRLIDGQLGLQAQMGVMSQVVIETREETRQLKRAVDYLLSRDGEKGES
jgi:predicted phage-related endonuclease